jgi:hypothetical protein
LFANLAGGVPMCHPDVSGSNATLRKITPLAEGCLFLATLNGQAFTRLVELPVVVNADITLELSNTHSAEKRSVTIPAMAVAHVRYGTGTAIDSLEFALASGVLRLQVPGPLAREEANSD